MKFKYFLCLLFFTWVTDLFTNPIYIEDLPLKIYITTAKQNFKLDEDIKLRIEVINNGTEPVFIYPAAYKLLNFDFKIINLKNASLVEKVETNINSLKEANPYLLVPREVQLYPDEIYKVELNLNEYYKIEESGRYKIVAEFKPYYENDKIKFISNPLYLNILPSERQRLETEIVKELKQREEEKFYTPVGTIEFILNSKIKGDWNNYFLYQNLDLIIMKYPKFSDRYLKASPEMKRDIIEEYKNWEINRVDNKIEEYEIQEVTESLLKGEAKVRCKIKYKKPAVFQTYIYEFYLVKKGNKWFLNDFEVINYEK